jgi:hypothetical protein
VSPPPAPEPQRLIEMGGTVAVVVLAQLGVLTGLVWSRRRRRRNRAEPTRPDGWWGPPSAVDVPTQRDGTDHEHDLARKPARE